MKVIELKIGYLVETRDWIGEVVCIDERGNVLVNGEWHDCKDLSGIALDEEWIIGFGFELMGEVYRLNHLNHLSGAGYFQLQKSSENQPVKRHSTFDVTIGDFKVTEIRAVHELQEILQVFTSKTTQLSSSSLCDSSP